MKGALLLAALPAAIAVGGAATPLFGIVGAGLVIGGGSISVAEIIAIGAIIIAPTAVLKGQGIESVDMKSGEINFK